MFLLLLGSKLVDKDYIEKHFFTESLKIFLTFGGYYVRIQKFLSMRKASEML
jgi:hypothetical protein